MVNNNININNIADLINQLFPNKFENHKILDHDLYLNDAAPCTIWGDENQYISSQGLDNLASCYSVLKAFITSDIKDNCLILIYDHEEIGSKTSSGAASNIIENVLFSFNYQYHQLVKILSRSILISIDVTHAASQSYLKQLDCEHQPQLNQGIVLKYSSSNNYTHDHKYYSWLRYISDKATIPYQLYVTNNNIPAGSTVGPIISCKYGINAIDIGVPILAMHSIRETAGIKDIDYMTKAMQIVLTSNIPC